MIESPSATSSDAHPVVMASHTENSRYYNAATVYGQSFFWTKPDGTTMTGFTYGHASKHDALCALRDWLVPMGWNEPKWWQASRWGDTPRSFPI